MITQKSRNSELFLKNKIMQNEFSYSKKIYGKFSSISLGHLIKHKVYYFRRVIM